MSDRDGSFFGRRKGKTLKPRQREALANALPQLLLDLSASPPERLETLFPPPVEAVWLEIGFGGGEHLLSEARAFPNVGLVGVEPFRNGLAR